MTNTHNHQNSENTNQNRTEFDKLFSLPFSIHEHCVRGAPFTEGETFIMRIIKTFEIKTEFNKSFSRCSGVYEPSNQRALFATLRVENNQRIIFQTPGRVRVHAVFSISFLPESAARILTPLPPLGSGFSEYRTWNRSLPDDGHAESKLSKGHTNKKKFNKSFSRDSWLQRISLGKTTFTSERHFSHINYKKPRACVKEPRASVKTVELQATKKKKSHYFFALEFLLRLFALSMS